MNASQPSVAGRRDTSLRVRAETHEKLSWLAEREGLPLTQYVERLAERERRRVRVAEASAAFARLKADPGRWAAYKNDIGQIDGLAGDGLEDADGGRDDPWSGDWEAA